MGWQAGGSAPLEGAFIADRRLACAQTIGSRSNVPLRMGEQGDIDDDAGAVMAKAARLIERLWAAAYAISVGRQAGGRAPLECFHCR